MPIAVVTSLLAASAVYIAVQTALTGAFTGLGKASDAPLADAALAVAPGLGFLVAAGGVISTLGFVSGSALGTPRYLFAAAEDGHLPRALARVHPHFESPHLAVLATGAIACLLVIPFDYRSLIGMSNVSVAVQYLATCLAVLKVRRTAPSARAALAYGTALSGARRAREPVDFHRGLLARARLGHRVTGRGRCGRRAHAPQPSDRLTPSQPGWL